MASPEAIAKSNQKRIEHIEALVVAIAEKVGVKVEKTGPSAPPSRAELKAKSVAKPEAEKAPKPKKGKKSTKKAKPKEEAPSE